MWFFVIYSQKPCAINNEELLETKGVCKGFPKFDNQLVHSQFHPNDK